MALCQCFCLSATGKPFPPVRVSVMFLHPPGSDRSPGHVQRCRLGHSVGQLLAIVLLQPRPLHSLISLPSCKK